jgi:DNA-damage-inducible protein J
MRGEKMLPVEPLIPNTETVEAIRAARRGELVTVGGPDKLLASLNAGG